MQPLQIVTYPRLVLSKPPIHPKIHQYHSQKKKNDHDEKSRNEKCDCTDIKLILVPVESISASIGWEQLLKILIWMSESPYVVVCQLE